MDGIILRLKENGEAELYQEPYTTIECETEEDYNRLEYLVRNNQDQYDQLILGGGRRLWKGFMPMVILFRNNYLASSCVPDPIQYLE